MLKKKLLLKDSISFHILYQESEAVLSALYLSYNRNTKGNQAKRSLNLVFMVYLIYKSVLQRILQNVDYYINHKSFYILCYMDI